MGVSRYNSEGYPDPTTYEALTSIEKETKAARAYDRLCMYAPRFPEILPGTLQMHESTVDCCGAGVYPHCSAFAVSAVP